MIRSDMNRTMYRYLTHASLSLFLFIPVFVASQENDECDAPIVAWDIHDVILRKPGWSYLPSACAIAWKYSAKRKLISHINMRLVRSIVTLMFKKQWDQLFDVLVKENPYLADCINQLFSDLYPIEGTVDIIHELKEKGYSLHILSNIWPSSYAVLEKNFSALFSLFDTVQIQIREGDNRIEKPTPAYFQHYLDQYNPKNKQIIFVDDKEKNIKAAQQHDIIGVKFENPKQLRNAFSQLNLLGSVNQII